MKRKINNIFKISIIMLFLVALFKTNTSDDVFAFADTSSLTITFRDGYTSSQGYVEYSVNDGASWTKVTSNINNQAIVMTGDNLRIRVVPESGHHVDFAGMTYRENDEQPKGLNESANSSIAGGLTGSNGYYVSSTATSVALEMIEFSESGVEPGGPNFDGKAYVVWSCGTGTCYHYFDNIPNFDDGKSTFYKDTDVTADYDTSIKFDVKAERKDWILKEGFERWVNAYKQKRNVSEIDWTHVDPEDIIGDPPDMRDWEEQAIEAGTCTRENTPQDVFQDCVDGYYAEHSDNLPFVKLQPLGEPTENNAYVSYGDRNFKVVIYNSKFKGITMADLSQLNYYPAQWTNPFLMRDQFDISDSTRDKPALMDSILLERTVIIKALNYNSLNITDIEALDVPEDAVNVVKDGSQFKLIFSSNFYDDVLFKITDTNGVSYLRIKRYTIDSWIKHVDNHPVLTADFYFDEEKSYADFDITAKIVYKNGKTKNVTLTASLGIDDGLGNITDAYEVAESDFGGKGLKKASFNCDLDDGDDERTIDKIYLNAEFKGSTTSNYAGSYVGSGEGVLANIYHGEEE